MELPSRSGEGIRQGPHRSTADARVKFPISQSFALSHRWISRLFCVASFLEDGASLAQSGFTAFTDLNREGVYLPYIGI